MAAAFFNRFTRGQLIAGGLLTYTTGVVLTLTFWSPDPDKESIQHDHSTFPTESQRRSIFDTLSTGYDSDINFHERILGIQRWRKKLLTEHATGRVLEIAAGTGRNIDYYPLGRNEGGGGGKEGGGGGKCTEIVFTDFSSGMMNTLMTKIRNSELGKLVDYQERRKVQVIKENEERKTKYEALTTTTTTTTSSSPSPPTTTLDLTPVPSVTPKLSFKIMNASSIPYPDQSFDTIVDTFGLCSFEDPVQVLKEMKRVLIPGGKILLLEHGNSDWGFMKRLQAKQLKRHVDQFGCYWNREIKEVVEQAGLTIQEEKRAQLGTLYYLVVS